jgi:hypothetical protein
MRLPSVLKLVALVCLAFIAAAPSGSAEERDRPAAPNYSLPSNGPTLKLAKKATAQQPQTAEAAPLIEECETGDACPAKATEADLASHRRGAKKKKSAAEATLAETADAPIERLQELCSGEVVLQPIIVHSTLAEAMRRVALWGDCCPLCGRSPLGKDQNAVEMHRPTDSLTRRKVLDIEVPDAVPTREAAPAPLRAGEPAQVILDTQKRLGKSVTDGTEFGGSPDLLIQWIRILDEENRRQQLALEETEQVEVSEPCGEDARGTARSQVEALRLACRQLQEAADLLEEQNLFESADSLRGIADVLRRQSRHRLSQDSPVDETPTGQPRHAKR